MKIWLARNIEYIHFDESEKNNFKIVMDKQNTIDFVSSKSQTRADLRFLNKVNIFLKFEWVYFLLDCL